METRPPSLLSEVMRALRRAERFGEEELMSCIAGSSRLQAALPTNLGKWQPHVRLLAVQNLAVELAKGEAKGALNELNEQKDDLSQEQLGRARGAVLRQLRRLSPGKGVSFAATMDCNGDIVTDGKLIANSLRDHWKTPFSHRPVDESKLQAWLRKDSVHPSGLKAATAPVLQDASQWRLKKRHMRQALDMAGRSAPGPDGIPYAAWKRLGPLGLEILYASAAA